MSLREVIPNNFVSLLQFFGISLDGNRDNSFMLNGEVLPVVLLGSVAPIQAISSPMTLDAPFTAGPLAAATAANTVHADTGAQSAGIYNVTVAWGQDRTAGTFAIYLVQRRNAANAANIWEQQFCVGQENADKLLVFTMQLQEGERLRVLNKVVSNFTTQQVSIWLQRLA